MIKNKVLICFLCWTLIPFSAVATEIRFLALASEPIAFKEGAQVKGIYVDILKEFSARMGHSKAAKVEITPFPRLLKIMENPESGCVVSILFPSPELPQKIQQVVPVADFTNTLISLRSSPLTWSNLQGKSIAGIRKTEFSYGPTFSQLIKSQNVAIVHVNRSPQGLEMLERGRVDGVFGPITFQKYWAGKIGLDWNSKVAEPLFIPQTTSYLMFSSAPDVGKPKSEDIKSKMTSVITSMRNDLFIEKTFESYVSASRE